jgi:hypothetical protein
MLGAQTKRAESRSIRNPALAPLLFTFSLGESLSRPASRADRRFDQAAVVAASA